MYEGISEGISVESVMRRELLLETEERWLTGDERLGSGMDCPAVTFSEGELSRGHMSVTAFRNGETISYLEDSPRVTLV
jgi:hypothetical protein